MKITLQKVITETPIITSGGCKVEGFATTGFTATPKYKFVEHPTIYLCTEIEKILGLSNIAIGTKLELNIDKFCVTPPIGTK